MMSPEDLLWEQIKIMQEIERRRLRKKYLTAFVIFVMIGVAYLYWS